MQLFSTFSAFQQMCRLFFEKSCSFVVFKKHKGLEICDFHFASTASSTKRVLDHVALYNHNTEDGVIRYIA